MFSLPAEIKREYIAAKREELLLTKERQQSSLELEEKELSNLEKKLTILEKFKKLGINTDNLEKSAISLAETFSYLQIENTNCYLPAVPINQINSVDGFFEDDITEDEESISL